MKNISLAICLKNEETTIVNSIKSLISASIKIESDFNVHYYVCFNGTTDSSKDLVNKWLTENNHLSRFKVIDLKEGNLVEAQRVVVKDAENLKCGYFGFFDADIIIDENSIKEMIDVFNRNKDTIVVYASSKPILREGKETFLERVMNIYDCGTTIYSERKYLHGRAFITKEWSIPKTDPPLMVDDIYLSFFYLSKYGNKSIKRSPNSVVGFLQIRSFKDFYRVFRRRNIEVKKIITLFPEFKNLSSEQINRRIIWKKLFSSKNFFMWMYFFLIKFISKYKLKLEQFWDPLIREQWETSISSKRTRIRPLLVLIEGLDCSGKKTLARELRKRSLELGVSSEVNLGPLGPSWYKKLSHIISTHRFPSFMRSIIYGLEIILGTNTKRGARGDIIFQVSSTIRSFTYSKISRSRFRCFIFKLFSWRIPEYDHVIYLTTSYELRKKRHKNQVAAGENSDNKEKRFKTKVFFEDFENLILFQLEKYVGEYDIYNTSDILAEDLSSNIIVDIISKL
jgi:glycosyltransferase involved in cell wall biosynthesis